MWVSKIGGVLYKYPLSICCIIPFMIPHFILLLGIDAQGQCDYLYSRVRYKRMLM